MTATETIQKPPPKVPRWLVRTIWVVHRAAYSVTGGRFGLRTPTSTRWGMLRLTSVGRRSGKTRVAILGYIEDGPNLITPAMNGWADPEPAWWLNLQANPEATVVLPGGSRKVTARAAVGDERGAPVGNAPRAGLGRLHRCERRAPLPRDRDRRAGATGLARRRTRSAAAGHGVRVIPGMPSKPVSKVMIRPTSRACITATWIASRAERVGVVRRSRRARSTSARSIG